MAEKTRIEAAIETHDPRKLVTLESGENARFMSHEQYQRLVENVQRDGCLTSVPFAYINDDGNLQVLSGNHRTKAAIDAGLSEIAVLVCRHPLTKDERIAIQLSHNAITGQDDPTMLARLYDEISDVDLRIYTGLDDEVLDMMEPVDVKGISEAQLDSRSLMFVFFPHELDSVNETLQTAASMLPNADQTLGFERSQYEELLKAAEDVERLTGIRNRATALRLILQVFDRNKDDLLPEPVESEEDEETPVQAEAAPLDED